MKKREFPNFAPWDAHGMAAHLEAMESGGWRFQGVSWLGAWEYESCTPAAVRYAVAYAPSRKNWRLTPTEQELDLENLCTDAGWRKIDAASRFHVYRNEDPNATPLETEESVRLDTIHRSFLRDLCISAALTVVYMAVLLGTLSAALAKFSPKLLAMPLPALLLFPVWMLLESIVPLFFYLPWMKSARKAAELGEPCPEVRFWKPYRMVSQFFMVLVLILLLTGEFWIMAAYSALYAVFAALRHAISKGQEEQTERERKYQNLLFFLVIGLVLLNFFLPLLDLYPKTPLPVSMADLGVAGEHTSKDLEHCDGLLAEYRRYHEVDEATGQYLFVTYYEPHIPLFEEECDAWFYDYAAYSDDVTDADPTLWGAEKAYHFGDGWLLYYEDCTLTLYTNWPLTDAEIARAADALGG